MASRIHQPGASGRYKFLNNEEGRMPIVIENDYATVSLNELVGLHERGFSVLKSPHVGNQHPSNLVCAALKIPLEMVSFTQGTKDFNFHPHLRIAEGQGSPLYPQRMYTPFGRLANGQSATVYHQQSVRDVFPHTEVCTDMERMQQYPALAAKVLIATNAAMRGLWYRHTDAEGHVTRRSVKQLGMTELETDVFHFSNERSGWVVPNRVNMIFDFAYQALSSGRDTIYHLSGPQMVHYIRGYTHELNILYDAVRVRMPDLPLVLRIRIVPVASARFVVRKEKAARLRSVCEVFEGLSPAQLHPLQCVEMVQELPELVQPIESARCLSQYDLRSVDDLTLDPWMLQTPLKVVRETYDRLMRPQSLKAAE